MWKTISVIIYFLYSLFFFFLFFDSIFFLLYCLFLFYFLDYLFLFYISGDHDICYYNAKCERPSGHFLGIKSLNNVYSNISYVVVGLGFIFYVFGIRCYVKTGETVAGIPRDASIPYAMGLAILLEGIVIMNILV
jgi:hypothetical protein